MRYQDLLDEYRSLLEQDTQIQRQLAVIAKKDALKARQEELRQKQLRLEHAAAVLDTNLSRLFFFWKQCVQMDAMPLEKRPEALSFAKAMTALEGLPARRETEQNLDRWAKGEVRFSEFYLPILQEYRVVECDQTWMTMAVDHVRNYEQED